MDVDGHWLRCSCRTGRVWSKPGAAAEKQLHDAGGTTLGGPTAREKVFAVDVLGAGDQKVIGCMADFDFGPVTRVETAT